MLLYRGVFSPKPAFFFRIQTRHRIAFMTCVRGEKLLGGKEDAMEVHRGFVRSLLKSTREKMEVGREGGREAHKGGLRICSL